MEARCEDCVDGPIAESGLPEREQGIVCELAQDADTQVAFQGLRRRLDLHQQILVRALKRLERKGLVTHNAEGYRLTEKGLGVACKPGCALERQEPLRILTAALPPHLDAAAVTRFLEHRWFRGLRWYGKSTNAREHVLAWLTEPGGHLVRIRLGMGAVTVEAEAAPDEAEALFSASRVLLGALSNLYESRDRASFGDRSAAPTIPQAAA